MTDFHTLPPKQILSHLNVDAQSGLSDLEIEKRIALHGKNTLPQSRKATAMSILFSQIKSTIVIILLVAATISFLYGHHLDGYIILGIIAVNSFFGFIQEYQAERSIEALKNLIVPRTQVRRNGKILVVSSQEVVPGDIVLCDEGDTVPADARLLSINNLQVDESSLTGESLPVTKSLEQLAKAVPLAEQANMLWMGTQVVAGECEAVVVGTGDKTILGQIAKDLSGVEEEIDHFKIKTDQLGRQMGMVAITVTLLVFFTGYFIRHFDFQEIFLFALASLVSALPEGLPVVLTVILAVSAKRMASRKAIVRRLSATETLAVVNTIVTDKTGTLTRNQMTAVAIKLPYQPVIDIKQDDNLSFRQDGLTPTTQHFPLQKLLDIIGTCHNVKREYDATGRQSFSGDPTEMALVNLADKATTSSSYYHEKIKQVYDLPFNQDNRWRASLVEYLEDDKVQLFAVGSPETLIQQCTQVLLPDHQHHALSENRLLEIENQIEDLSSQGMRVLAVAYRDQETVAEIDHNDVRSLVFVGLVGLIDPPHPDTKQAIEAAHRAGIRVIMATGDHPLTAKTIGLQLGLLSKNDTDEAILTESEINNLSDEELIRRLPTVKIYARMSPSSKLRLASLLQKQGRVVAMTGDGVNDAPALKQADIGIGMGKRGTDVAREASDIVLADDNFSNIIAAIEEGRTQLRNVRRTSFFYITTNFAESLTLLVFLFSGLPIPLLPKQILWLNLVTGAVTDLALATEPPRHDILSSKPGNVSEGIINRKNIPYLITLTITISALGTLFFLLYLNQGVDKARTILFVVLSIAQIYNMFNLRSLKESIFTLGIFSSRNINLAFVASTILMLVAVFMPGLRTVLGFSSVDLVDVGWCFLASLLIVIVGESYKKLIVRR